jgi:flagellar hook-length control protein FliK
MIATTVEPALPEITVVPRSTRPSQSASTPDTGKASFDRCLQSASEKPTKAAEKPAENEQSTEEARGETETTETEKTDAAGDAAEKNAEKGAASLADTDALLALLGEQQVVEVEVNFEATNNVATEIAVQIVDTQGTTTDAADEALPTGQAETTPTDFTPQLVAAQANDASAQVADNAAQQRPEIEQVKNEAPSLQTERSADEDFEQIETHTEKTDAGNQESAQLVRPTAPAPEPPASVQNNTLALNPGEQMRVDVRQVVGAGGVEAAGGADVGFEVDGPQVVGQVVRGASMMISQGRSEVRVQLRPPELGTVRIQLVSDRSNVVEARIVAERDEVRQLIARNLPELRESLSASGVQVGGFDVSTQQSGQTPFEESTGSSNNTPAWDGAEPEDEEISSAFSGPARGVNRSVSDGEIDYIV